MTAYAELCSVPGCQLFTRDNRLCQPHDWRLSHYGDTFPNIPIGAFTREFISPHESGVCRCTTSRPAPKCCVTCGYPCVHRMAPHIRDRAFAKWPSLTAQVVTDPRERGAA